MDDNDSRGCAKDGRDKTGHALSMEIGWFDDEATLEWRPCACRIDPEKWELRLYGDMTATRTGCTPAIKTAGKYAFRRGREGC